MKYIFIFIVLSMTVVACEDMFTTTKELNLPEHKSKLSVFSNLHDSICDIFIGHSKSFDDNSPYQEIKAVVSIYKNDEKIMDFNYPEDVIPNKIHGYQIKLSENIEENAKYSLIVDSEKFGTCKSTQISPVNPVVKELKYIVNGGGINYGDTLDKIEVTISDDPDTKDYYAFDIVFENVYQGYYHSFLISDDPSTNEVSLSFFDGAIVSDKTFNGHNRKFSFNLYKPEIYVDSIGYVYPDTIYFNTKSITKEYFDYILSNYWFFISQDDPFVEPVNVSDNIENGYGSFAVYSNVSKLIRLK